MQFLLGIQQVDERAGSHLHILQPIKLPGFGHARLASIEDVKDAAQTFNLTPRLCELSAHLVTDAGFSGVGRAQRVGGTAFARSPRPAAVKDRKSVVEGKSVSVRLDLGGRRIIKKKKHN